MFKRFMPVEHNFFKLFQQAATELVHASQDYQSLITDIDNSASHAERISAHEEQADKIALTIYGLLHKTFITPFDREDIHLFTSQLDDIIDTIHQTSQRISIYHLKGVPQELIALASLIVEAASLIQKAIEELETLKNVELIIKVCADVNVLENRADKLVLQGVSDLFQHESDLKQLLKLKEVFEHTQDIVAKCQDLTNIIKGIVLEYA